MTRGRALIVTAALLVAAAVLLLVFVLRLSSKPSAKTNLSTSTFRVGPAERLAKPIANDGPVLLPDLLHKDRDIFVQHLGSDPKQGWLAFDSRPPGEKRTCYLRWRKNIRDFRDPCSGRVYPADGAGLVHYKTTVDSNGEVVVDLRTRAGVPTPPVSAG
jgi:hypothetical protein